MVKPFAYLEALNHSKTGAALEFRSPGKQQ